MYNDIKAGIYETLLRGCSKEDEDSVIKDLLETNIRQRGDIGGSAKKVGRRIMELERLYGVRDGSSNEKGNNRIGEPNNSVDNVTQSDLAAKLGMSVDTLQNVSRYDS